jgi:uncharacterized protein (TIGR02145 family)
MKAIFRISGIIYLIFLILWFYSCKKEFVPTLTTTDITNITSTSVISGGTITDEGSSPVIARGVCWNKMSNPTVEDNKTVDNAGIGTFNSSITGLSNNITYYLRSYATNGAGTSYGNELSFILWMNVPGPSITDADGNSYYSVKIGVQIWMAKNLNTTKYNDISLIPNLTINSEWEAEEGTTGHNGAYCWYDNDAATYKTAYGAFYNWYAVNTGKLCPVGWHIPSDAEWTVLVNYLGGEYVAGDKLKEAGQIHWYGVYSGQSTATNESGFTALGGGHRTYYGAYEKIGTIGLWWSATSSDATGAVGCGMSYGDTDVGINGPRNKKEGYSVRCIKD